MTSSKSASLVFKSADEAMGEGDTSLVKDLLDPEMSERAFDEMKREVNWNVMRHHGGEVPRLVAVQGEINEDGSFPIYRHPADESPPLLPFTPTVSAIRSRVQQIVGHPLNHVLIQLYRSGTDYISEHSDKTIDVDRHSKIVNVSLGAQRTMILRRKKPTAQIHSGLESTGTGISRESERVHLPHNSLFVMGLSTNQKWLHSIRQDNRLEMDKEPESLAFAGERISLTFRKINTFLSADQRRIYGQGSTRKDKEGGGAEVVNGPEDAEGLIRAFSVENKESDEFDWEKVYGCGFDVVHFTIAEGEKVKAS